MRSFEFPETACNAVIRDPSRRILDGRRPRLGALLPLRLAEDPDAGLVASDMRTSPRPPGTVRDVPSLMP
jgi:hypothetical protein